MRFDIDTLTLARFLIQSSAFLCVCLCTIVFCDACTIVILDTGRLNSAHVIVCEPPLIMQQNQLTMLTQETVNLNDTRGVSKPEVSECSVKKWCWRLENQFAENSLRFRTRAGAAGESVSRGNQ